MVKQLRSTEGIHRHHSLSFSLFMSCGQLDATRSSQFLWGFRGKFCWMEGHRSHVEDSESSTWLLWPSDERDRLSQSRSLSVSGSIIFNHRGEILTLSVTNFLGRVFIGLIDISDYTYGLPRSYCLTSISSSDSSLQSVWPRFLPCGSRAFCWVQHTGACFRYFRLFAVSSIASRITWSHYRDPCRDSFVYKAHTSFPFFCWRSLNATLRYVWYFALDLFHSSFHYLKILVWFLS
jgi:hypothetical protein